MHPAIQSGRTAVVTGAASGIGLAAAKRFAVAGMTVWLADLAGDPLEAACIEVRSLSPGGPDRVRTVATDVGRREAVDALRDAACADGPPALVMLNVGIEAGGSLFSDDGTWRRILDTNLWGVINGSRPSRQG